MPKTKDLESGSESAKSEHDNGSGSEAEEEYVVEKVVDKRITKSGKVSVFIMIGFQSWPALLSPDPDRVLPEVEGLRRQSEHLGAKGKPGLRRTHQSLRAAKEERRQCKRKYFLRVEWTPVSDLWNLKPI